MSSDEWVVTMPKLGETVTEGVVSNWLKQVGDTVAFDDPLFEVSTDKVDSEIPSPYDGVIAGDPRAGGGDGAGRHAAGADRRARVHRRRASGPAPLGPAPLPATAGGPSGSGRPAAPQMGGSEGPGPRGRADPRARRRGARHHHAQARARPSPRARSATGSSRSATRSRSTTRCSRCRPTRSTPRSPARTTACCSRSWCRRGRPCRSAPRWPGSASPARPRPAGRAEAAGARGRGAPRHPPRLRLGPGGGAGRSVGRRRRPLLSPLVRRLAAENGLDVAAVPGTGSGGRIRREDVEKAHRGRRRRGRRTRPGRRPPRHAAAPRHPAAARGTGRGRGGTGEAGGDPRDEVVSRCPGCGWRSPTGMKALADDSRRRVWTSVEVDFDNVEQGAGQAQGPVQEGDRRVAVATCPSSPGRWSTRCGRSRRSTPRSTSRRRP